jgi:D-glycero-D-manno-heptose 1,7-bisphosphate phosphatase
VTDRLRSAQGYRRAVFLDRDGTLIEDVGFLGRVEQIQLYPWTIAAVKRLNEAGLPVVVTTNQSGVARGLLTEEAITLVHRHLSSVLEAGGARIDAYYYCPHHPEGTIEAYARVCECRKPGPGLIEQAVRDLALDPARSFVVGDKWLDIGLARAVGAQGILVRTGYGGRDLQPEGLDADAVVDNVSDAIDWILRTIAD